MNTKDTKEKNEEIIYAGLNLKKANDFIKMSKILAILSLNLGLLKTVTLFRTEKLIAEQEGNTFNIYNFLVNGHALELLLTALFLTLYILTRNIAFSVFVGCFLSFGAIGSFLENIQDGFSHEDLQAFLSLSFLNSIIILNAAFCMHAIKEINKKAKPDSKNSRAN